MINFLTNQEWKKNPSLATGDLLVLKFQDGFLYSVKCIVKNVASNNIIGHVEAVFDAQSGGELVQHEMKNKEISFTIQHVFNVVKKNWTVSGAPSAELQKWLETRERAAKARDAIRTAGGHMLLRGSVVNPEELSEPLRTEAIEYLRQRGEWHD